MADTIAPTAVDADLIGTSGVASIYAEKAAESKSDPFHSRVAANAALCVAMLLSALACSEQHASNERAPSSDLETIAHRLVDPKYRLDAQIDPDTMQITGGPGIPSAPGGMAGVASATIEDDTRYVLAAHARAWLKDHRPRLSGSGSGWAVSVPLGSELEDAEEVAALPLIKLPGKKWQTLDSLLVRVSRTTRGRFLYLDLPVKIPLSGKVQLRVEAHQPPGRTTSYRTHPIDVPGDASLEFSLGLLEAARHQGPVRFAIEACRDARCTALFDEVVDPSLTESRGWQDRRVDLTPLGGSPHSLRFTAEHIGDGKFSLPVWGAPTIVAPAAAPDPRRNIVLLSIDTLRRDHLDLYGYDRKTAPYLRSQLAERGTVLERLIAESSTTDPSHMSMFTSLPALVHGVTCCRERLAVPAVTLAEILSGHGYHTAAFTENGPLAHERGFSIGFDRYIENKTPGRIRPTGHVALTFSQARSWLQKQSDGPFFLFLHTFQVHAPYEPPAEYAHAFEATATRGATAEAGTMIDAYDREIRYTDDELRKLHEWMEASGINERTIWIVLSDHGEEFFEHGTRGHATLPYETVLRVPMIFQGPGIRQGHSITSKVRHIDLMPTILDLLGLPASLQSTGNSFAASLSEGAVAASEGNEANPPAFSSTWVLPKGIAAPALSVTAGDHKLIRYFEDGTERFEFYDLAADPNELNDRYSPDGTEPLRLRGLLLRHLEETAAQRRDLVGVESETSPLFDPDPDTEETLRALGYIE